VATSARPKKDVDTLTLVCKPNSSPTAAPGSGLPANPTAGPRARADDRPTGTDLDNGWTGSSHNFILVPNGKIDGCLSNCNSGSDTLCDFNARPARARRTGATFGAPLPLLASNVPVCVVSKWADDITAPRTRPRATSA
jgi:hypothetical protein